MHRETFSAELDRRFNGRFRLRRDPQDDTLVIWEHPPAGAPAPVRKLAWETVSPERIGTPREPFDLDLVALEEARRFTESAFPELPPAARRQKIREWVRANYVDPMERRRQREMDAGLAEAVREAEDVVMWKTKLRSRFGYAGPNNTTGDQRVRRPKRPRS